MQPAGRGDATLSGNGRRTRGLPAGHDRGDAVRGGSGDASLVTGSLRTTVLCDALLAGGWSCVAVALERDLTSAQVVPVVATGSSSGGFCVPVTYPSV